MSTNYYVIVYCFVILSAACSSPVTSMPLRLFVRLLDYLAFCNLSANIEAKNGKLSKMPVSLSEFNNSIFTLNGS